jgi:Cdc6-like AAA superfamily ATPase
MLTFEIAAKQTFPELTSTITRKQAQEVCQVTGAKWPNHIINMSNSVGRGVFKFSADLEIVGAVVAPVVVESDSELDKRIRETYVTLDKLVGAVAENKVNSLIVAGAPGLGKSYEVNRILVEINSGDYGYVFHRGYIKATHLFRLLWENRAAGQTVVLDDVDSIFADETALNILKAALELKDTRMVSWGSEKQFTDQDGEEIPRYFDYQGNVIFLTNLNFSELAAGNNKNSAHLSALESRSLVLDLKIKTKREVMAKIKLTVRDGMLRSKGLTESEEQELLTFMEEHLDKMKEISLRSMEKLAALFLMDKSDWKPMARTVMLK